MSASFHHSDRESRIRQTYALIHQGAAEGTQPSLRELCRQVNLGSYSTARLYLLELEARGWIRRAAKRSRAIAPTGKVSVLCINGKTMICEVMK